jgi:TolB-like protein
MLARGSGSTTVRSLAVLHLDSLSSDPSQEYFADGMTDQLITTLGQISALRVISRTSVMPYKGVRKPLPQIARELNVDAVVEGTVVRSGSQVRITAQLIDAVADRHLWAQSYDGDLRDTLALQNTVARAIAEQIRINVTPQEQVALKHATVVNPEAYEAYLKG